MGSGARLCTSVSYTHLIPVHLLFGPLAAAADQMAGLFPVDPAALGQLVGHDAVKKMCIRDSG